MMFLTSFTRFTGKLFLFIRTLLGKECIVFLYFQQVKNALFHLFLFSCQTCLSKTFLTFHRNRVAESVYGTRINYLDRSFCLFMYLLHSLRPTKRKKRRNVKCHLSKLRQNSQRKMCKVGKKKLRCGGQGLISSYFGDVKIAQFGTLKLENF